MTGKWLSGWNKELWRVKYVSYMIFFLSRKGDGANIVTDPRVELPDYRRSK
jgi:hypothetical protein